MFQHVSEPTHYRAQQKANILDLVMTNEEGMVGHIEHSEPIGKSHHMVLSWKVNCYTEQLKSRVTKYCYDKGNFNEMRKNLAAMDWKAVLNNQSVEQMWEQISKKLTEEVDANVPHRTYKSDNNSGRRKPMWMNDRSMLAIRRKKSAYQNYLATREGRDYLEYVKNRNEAKQELRKAVRNFEKEISKKAKKDPKAFYKYVNSQLKTRNGISELLKDDGTTATNDLEKAETLNEFFSSVFTREDLSSIPEQVERQLHQQLLEVTFTHEEVLKILKSLKTDKSPGPDKIHARVLKECAEVLTEPLYELFRQSLNEGRMPQSWKEGHITSIFKKGLRTKVDNYRPVSLTSVVSKVMEKIMRKAILEHMSSNNILSDSQHGFIQGRSCTTQLLQVIDKWTEIIDNGGNIDNIYLDFAKAFDSVPHRRLIIKLQSYGIEGKVLNWIDSFLTDRRQKVLVNGSESRWAKVLSGVPQGSVLGPILFVCYINDMPDTISSLIYMYADDTKISRVVNMKSDWKALQKDLNSLQEWSNKWQLKFNSSKCKVMHLGNDNRKHRYSMMENEVIKTLEESAQERDLGVLIDDELKFVKHIENAVSKSNQLLGLIKRSFVYKNGEVMKKLFTSLVRPLLEYGNVIWYPRHKKEAEILERVQRRATKMIQGMTGHTYEDRLKLLDLPTLVYRRYRGDAIEVYKYLRGVYNVDSSSLLPRAFDTRTRGHEYKLLKRPCRGQLRSNFFSMRVVNLWNSLPEDVVSAPSLNAFKGRLDRAWKKMKFTLDTEIFEIK